MGMAKDTEVEIQTRLLPSLETSVAGGLGLRTRAFLRRMLHGIFEQKHPKVPDGESGQLELRFLRYTDSNQQ